jgi:hypothetical protein
MSSMLLPISITYFLMAYALCVIRFKGIYANYAALRP